MIKITSTNDVIIVEGDELTRHYPYNGTLVIPKNSTLVLLDEKSEMVLFKSASNYDTLFTGILGSISIEDELVTRDNIIEKFNAISNVIQGGGNVDLFEVVQSLPTENISDNKVYLVLDSNGSEGNTYVEYLYVNGQWEELGKFKVNIDLSGYATEEWVNSQGFLKEHQDISNLATKAELETKQDTINDLETIRSGAAKGATALQEVPSEYVTETELNNKGYLTSVPDTYALKSDIPDITTKQDTLVSGTNIKTINGNSLLGSGDITIEGGSGNVDLSDYYTKTQTNALVSPKLSQVTLTQAEYDALQTKENNVLYVISDAEDLKFKTINGQQITGDGDITIDTNVDLSNYATKSELNTKQNVITDLETIRSGAALGSTALQSVPSGYATEQWVNSQGFLKEHQDISNLATKSELATKQDTLVSGTNIKSINGTSLLGSGNIEVTANVDLSGYYTKSEIDEMIGGASTTITQINNLVG